jgi:hypothetical protein
MSQVFTMPLPQSEEALQSQCETYLRVKQLRFVHIPGKIQRFIWSPICPKWVGALASHYLKGIPDLLIFSEPRNGVRSCLTIELKSAKGRETAEQKLWEPVVCRDITHFREVVDSWEHSWEHFG